MKWKIFGMIWNGRFQVWNGIVWKILPAMEDGRFAFHSIVCPAWNNHTKSITIGGGTRGPHGPRLTWPPTSKFQILPK